MIDNDDEEFIRKHLFKDSTFEAFTPAQRERLHVGLNWPYQAKERRLITLVALRKEGGTHWGINVKGLQYVLTLLREKRISGGYVVLTDNYQTIVSMTPVADVWEKLKNVSPRPGKFGDFWWVTEAFDPAEPELRPMRRYVSDDELF